VKDLKEKKKAFVKIIPQKFADSTHHEYDRLRIFYGNVKGIIEIIIKENNHNIYTDTLKRERGINEIACKLSVKKRS